MEALLVILDDVLVQTNQYFIHMPTVAREYRPAAYVMTRFFHERAMDLLTTCGVPGEVARQDIKMPSSRMFTDSQLAVIKDKMAAPLTTDLTTYFSMRPPELRFVCEHEKYLKWFHRTSVTSLSNEEAAMKYLRQHLHTKLDKCQWIDGFNNKIVLFPAAIAKCLEYAETCPAINFGVGPESHHYCTQLIQLLQ